MKGGAGSGAAHGPWARLRAPPPDMGDAMRAIRRCGGALDRATSGSGAIEEPLHTEEPRHTRTRSPPRVSPSLHLQSRDAVW